MDSGRIPERKSKQKKDPAWEYCEIYINGDKKELRCVFCGKIFKGGGIHRVKEHLAGAKGDGGSPCLKVDPDVRAAMQENLSGIVGKRGKKQKFIELSPNVGNVTEDESIRNSYDLNTVDGLLQFPDTIEANSNKRSKFEHSSREMNGGQKAVVISRGQAISEEESLENFEPAAVSAFKRDSAWKHCDMYRNGKKVILRCLYCGKIFHGGGIYRLKEHLAGRIGNGAICPKVQADVRLQMQESLQASVSGKQKKGDSLIQKPFVQIPEPDNDEAHGLSSGRDLNNDFDLFGEDDKFEQSLDQIVNQVVEGSGVGGVTDKGHEGKSYNLKFHKSSALTGENNRAIGSRSKDNEIQKEINSFLLNLGMDFDATVYAQFQSIIQKLASQKSHVVTPSWDDIRSRILKDAAKEVKSDIDKFTGCWARSGCSILFDEWITVKGRTFLNVLVHCSEGTLYLKSLDITCITDSIDALYQLLANVLEEVGVSNVLQVITSGEERYIVIGKRLENFYPSVFWTPCASHCLSLILEDFGRLEWINELLEQCKSMTRFIYNHNVVLNMMRKCTFGVDLVDIGMAESVTDFMTLNRMMSVKDNLRNMVNSEEWAESSYTREPEGLTLQDNIRNESFWSTCGLIVRLTEPLLSLLRIVGNEKRPAMGYIYAGLYKAKEAIKKELVSQKDYFDLWDIIDRRWEHLQHHPLVAAAFYFNPKFFYSTEVNVPQMKSRLYDSLEKLVPDPNIQDKIVKEKISYENAVGDFGRKMAIRARDTLLPAEWWATYGGACPNLSRYAIRILNLTCSLMASKPKHLIFEDIHETKNCLEKPRLDDLLSVQYNWWLKQRASKHKDQGSSDPLMYAKSNTVSHWVMKEETEPKNLNVTDWSIVLSPSGNRMQFGSQADDYEALGTGFDDIEVFNRGVKEEAVS
ncbi:OLC1v1020230C2 [Oldenlandia corymbosa var. corymbosa]|uniref:OLC1v1020230C2 n=1 Tax=Oldenlandia corymbosa var. corymbosa TaxID=529605 RepID=A0AAV1EG49_OLDCO|nr:OLC1v1020230C2 [Oldenlandia corymbosa var. corymbosa]